MVLLTGPKIESYFRKWNDVLEEKSALVEGIEMLDSENQLALALNVELRSELKIVDA